jgi:NADH-quinone oxidoreductase subunit H
MNIGPLYVPIELIRILLAILLLSMFVGINGFVLVYIERKVAGHIQRRPGPFEVGPHGILQTVADAVKLVGKQLVTPAGVDRVIFWLAPLLAFFPVFVLFLPMPFGPILTTLKVDLGLLLILAFAGVNVLAICLAGWSSRNKWSLLGAARAVSQCVAYEIPMLLALLAVAFMEGSLNLEEIVSRQGHWPWQWNVIVQPIAFLVFFIAAVAETNRSPFDLPEAESELTAGFHTEYSGMGFGLFMLSEYAYMVVVCCVASAVFLGGWKGPLFPGFWWFLGKAYLLLLVIMWFRWTYPRVRFDQLLNLNWKWLLPLSLLNLLITAFVMKIV